MQIHEEKNCQQQPVGVLRLSPLMKWRYILGSRIQNKEIWLMANDFLCWNLAIALVNAALGLSSIDLAGRMEYTYLTI